MQHLWSSDGVECTCMRAGCGRKKTSENEKADDCGCRNSFISFDDPVYIGQRMRAIRQEEDAWIARKE